MPGNKKFDVITVGFALFAMFFGAGNLILPPFIGLTAGSNWIFGVLGFLITGIAAVYMGLIAVTLSGDGFNDLGKRINPLFGVIIAAVIMLIIGPLIAIPRTAATTFEIGIQPLFPNFSPILSAVLFFGATLALAISPSKVVDIIGKYLTPLLLIILTLLIIMGVTNPQSALQNTGHNSVNSFITGFREGYQTMDALAAFVFAGIIIAAIKAKGYVSNSEKKKMTILAGGLAMICLFIVYGGLVYLGAASGYHPDGEIKRTDLLLHISHGVLGSSGTLLLSICVALACLTTAIALTSAVSRFFSRLTNNILTYQLLAVVVCVISGILSIVGVDKIINVAYPFLALIYPITLCMAVYIVFFGKYVKTKAPYVAAVLITSIIAIMGLLIEFDISKESLTQLIDRLPLSGYEIPWLIPSALAFAIVWGWQEKYKSFNQ